MGPPASRRIPRVLRYSGTGSRSSLFVYVAVTPFGWAFLPYSTKIASAYHRPSTPESMLSGLGSFLFARRYSGNRSFFLFLRVLRCFSSPGALYPPYRFRWKCRGIAPDGFPHSDISGSLPTCGSPKLFAAGRVLHRQLVPWHPPCALLCLISYPETISVSVNLLTSTGLPEKLISPVCSCQGSLGIPYGLPAKACALWWVAMDSNHRPLAYQASALTS